MIRIAFLDYSPIFAGAERMLYNVIAHLDRTKYAPVIIFPYPLPHQKEYDSLDCKKYYLSNSIKWWMGSDRWKDPIRGTDFLKRTIFGFKISGLLRRLKVDILDVNIIRGDVKMWVWATRKFTNAKIVGHYRSQNQDWVPPASAQRLFHTIACVSKFSRMRFRLKGEFTQSVVLYDAIDVDQMKCELTKDEAKAKLGYSPETILLTSVGQLSPHKGHDNAIRAFARIHQEFPNARLLIAGGGNTGLVNYYKNIAKSLNIEDKVDIPGKQFPNIPEIYRATDLTLSLTKVGEGFGLVPYESALLGTPFIAPEFGAIREFVEDGISGLLVNTNDISKIESKMRYALNNQKFTLHMIDTLKSIIYENLTPSTLATNLHSLYSSIYD